MNHRQSRCGLETPTRRTLRAIALLGAMGITMTGLVGAAPSAGATSSRSGGTVIQVVAAENFWGSIAKQIGGTHVKVTSIITNPNTDPHSYEPTAQDARTIAGAKLVIENAIGYDNWAAKSIAADKGNATVLNVGDLVGAHEGDNPHRWYNPSDVQTVIKQLVTDYQKLDPADSDYFTQQATTFNTVSLATYNSLIASIKATYGGTPVGASESIFSMLAPALGLNLITPYSFLRAISEGTDVTAADKTTIDNQIRNHQIKIYVYNSQNVTPDVKTQLAEVKKAKIPYATITETLLPAKTTYQAWQVKQLKGIQAALAKAVAG
jgi:zinc/manganese transport system substrate-binding protein